MTDILRGHYASDFRFHVLTGISPFAGIPGSDICFSRISGIGSTAESEEIAEGGRNSGPHLLAVPAKWQTQLVLERGVLPVSHWMYRLKPGMRLGTWLQIIVMDESGLPTSRQFWIEDGIVTKWELSDLNALGNSILIERMEILHDGINY